MKVKEGQVIALLEGKLAAAADSVDQAVLVVMKQAAAEEHELVTLMHGEDLDQTEANRIADAVRQAYPRLEIELQYGGQPHYQFILSIE